MLLFIPEVMIVWKIWLSSELNKDERDVIGYNPVLAYTIRDDAITAMTLGQQKFGEDENVDGRGDALRHCYFSALLTKHVGAGKAKGFTDAHEKNDDNTPAQREMDLHNNGVGIQIALKNPKANEEQLAELCVKAVLSGETIVIKGLGKNK